MINSETYIFSNLLMNQFVRAPDSDGLSFSNVATMAQIFQVNFKAVPEYPVFSTRYQP
jgi:hypothetical protein